MRSELSQQLLQLSTTSPGLVFEPDIDFKLPQATQVIENRLEPVDLAPSRALFRH